MQVSACVNLTSCPSLPT